MTHIVQIKTAKEVTRDLLDDILITAFDNPHGACWYWCEAGAGWLEDPEAPDGEELYIGVEIEYEHPIEESSEVSTVDHAVLLKGIQRILDSEGDINQSIQKAVMDAVLQDDASEVDAIIADAIVQWGLFGTGVFS